MWQDIRKNFLLTARRKAFKRKLFKLICRVFQIAKSEGQRTSKRMAFESSAFSQSVFPPHRLTISSTFMLQVFFHAAIENPCVLMRLILHERHNTMSIEAYLSVMLMLQFTICCRRKQQNPFKLMHRKPSFRSTNRQECSVTQHFHLMAIGPYANL